MSVQIKVKITRLIVVLSGTLLISTSLVFYFAHRPLYVWNYKGETLQFRADLRQADKVPAYPNESAVYQLIWKPNIEEIQILFQSDIDTSLIAVEAFEITYKLKVAYLKVHRDVKISAKEISSFGNISERLSPHSLGLVLIPPTLATTTAISMEDNVILIQGKTTEDFDLAVVKFLMILLEVKI